MQPVGEVNIYETNYTSLDEGPFETIGDAIRHALDVLPHEDQAYMIGFDDVIVGFVFQGQWYAKQPRPN